MTFWSFLTVFQITHTATCPMWQCLYVCIWEWRLSVLILCRKSLAVPVVHLCCCMSCMVNWPVVTDSIQFLLYVLWKDIEHCEHVCDCTVSVFHKFLQVFRYSRYFRPVLRYPVPSRAPPPPNRGFHGFVRRFVWGGTRLLGNYACVSTWIVTFNCVICSIRRISKNLLDDLQFGTRQWDFRKANRGTVWFFAPAVHGQRGVYSSSDWIIWSCLLVCLQRCLTPRSVPTSARTRTERHDRT